MGFRCETENCGGEVRVYDTVCPSCKTTYGFPNVRMAAASPERDTLARRAELAWEIALSRGAGSEMVRLAQKIRDAKVTIRRPIFAVHNWMKEGLYLTYAMRRAKGERPPDDRFNLIRLAFENYCHNMISDRLVYAFVGTHLGGPEKYGDVIVTLRDEIAPRVSLLERNSHELWIDHRGASPDRPPLGFRSTWEDRVMLAVAKIGPQLRQNMSDAEIDELISGTTGPETEFIEALIWDPIELEMIETLTLRQSSQSIDLKKWAEIEQTLQKANVIVRTVKC